jgi:hypothetical protein
MGCIMLKGGFCVPMSCLRWAELAPPWRMIEMQMTWQIEVESNSHWAFPTSAFISHVLVWFLAYHYLWCLWLRGVHQTSIQSCCGISVSLFFWWHHLQFEQILKSLICLGFDFNQVSSSISKSVGPKFVQLSLKKFGFCSSIGELLWFLFWQLLGGESKGLSEVGSRQFPAVVIGKEQFTA